jgi:hypothetical protein
MTSRSAAFATAADLLLVLRRGAVLAMSHSRSTRVIACFALAVSTVGSQSRRRASQHEKKSGDQDEKVDGQTPSERRPTREKCAERFQMPTSTWK